MTASRPGRCRPRASLAPPPPSSRPFSPLSVDLSSNRGRYTDRAIDELFERQKDETDPKMRYMAVRAFEWRMLEEAYTVPLLWWQRIVVMRSNVKGWGMTPSHLIGQDLETVWLKP